MSPWTKGFIYHRQSGVGLTHQIREPLSRVVPQKMNVNNSLRTFKELSIKTILLSSTNSVDCINQDQVKSLCWKAKFFREICSMIKLNNKPTTAIPGLLS